MKMIAEIMNSFDSNEIIKELFEPFVQRYQVGLE